MSKNGLMLVSLVGAIPGAALVFLMAMAFINYAAGPTMWSKALAGMSLLVGLLLTSMPLIIFVRGGPKAEKPAEKESKKEAGEEAEIVDASDAETIIAESEDGAEDGAEHSSAVTDESLEVVEGEPDEFSMTGELVTDDVDESSEEFDVGSDFEIGGGDEEAVDVIDEGDEFEEDAPKKKKK